MVQTLQTDYQNYYLYMTGKKIVQLNENNKKGISGFCRLLSLCVLKFVLA